MATARTMYVGDTYPDAQFQVSDETGVLDLSSAASIAVYWVGAKGTFSGAGRALQPPVADPAGGYYYNCAYTFASGDTATADIYTPYVVVTWSSTKIETFAVSNGDLVVKSRVNV